MNLDNVSRDDWIVGGLALLLVIDLLFLAWFSFGASLTVGGTTVSYSGSLTATDTPNGWLGVLAVISALLVIVDLAVERLSPQTQVPAVSGSRAMTRFVLAAAAAFFMALKFLFHLGDFSNLGIGFWIGVVLVAALVYFTLQARQARRMASGGGMAAPTPAAPPAPPVADPQATRVGQRPEPEAPPPGGSAAPPGSWRASRSACA